jgi:hypothetical protein
MGAFARRGRHGDQDGQVFSPATVATRRGGQAEQRFSRGGIIRPRLYPIRTRKARKIGTFHVAKQGRDLNRGLPALRRADVAKSLWRARGYGAASADSTVNPQPSSAVHNICVIRCLPAVAGVRWLGLHFSGAKSSRLRPAAAGLGRAKEVKDQGSEVGDFVVILE